MYSIIIPVYNSAQQLEKCVQSILAQKTNAAVEILLINDGSTDNSGLICDNLSSVDSRIRVFHKKNEGVSAARNFGLEQAKGEYILFVDSDDYIRNDTIDILDKQIQQYSPDVVVYDIQLVTNIAITFPQRLKNRISSSKDEVNSHLCCIYESGAFASCCNKAYKRSLIGDIRFREDLRYGEDLCFNLQVLANATSVITIGEGLYCYYQHPNSLSTNVDQRQINEMLTLFSQSDEFFNTLGIDPNEKNRLLTAHYFVYLYPYQISQLSNSRLLSFSQKAECIRSICQTAYGDYCREKGKASGLFQRLIKYKCYRLLILYCRLLSFLKGR